MTFGLAGSVTSGVAVATTPVLHLTSAQNVGINTTSPNDALDVVGDVDATGCFQTDNSTNVGGTCVSDRRLKEQIKPLDNTLERLLSLRPVTYVWRPEYFEVHKREGQELGLIAQEVEKVFPELVVEKEDGYKRVKYDISLSLYIIQSIKEFFGIYEEDKKVQGRKIASLEEENNLLKEEVESVKSKNKSLEQRNKMMEDYLCSKDPSAPFCP